MAHQVKWTPERTAKCERLWKEGLSASEVAERLGGFDHCDDGGRRAVLGKLDRLGLIGRRREDRRSHNVPLTRSAMERRRLQNIAQPWKPGDPKPQLSFADNGKPSSG